jgi:hypothetical protein
MRKLNRGSLMAAAVGMMLASALPASAANTYATNRLGFFYNNSYNRISEYQNQTSMLVTGRCNRYDAPFTTARQAGAEVLAYVNAVDISPNLNCDLETNLYRLGTNHDQPAPHWPYAERTEYVSSNGTVYPLADLTAGSAWADHVVAYVEALMRENKVDGVFLDVVGARLWSGVSDWPNWSQTEKDAWTLGNIDLVRRLHVLQQQVNPRFIIVNNNTWSRGDSVGDAGEQYVDGICLEHHAIGSFQTATAAKPFDGGAHRRMLIIANSDADVAAWADVQGVTHVSNQTSADGYASPARANPLTPHALHDRLKFFGRVVAGTQPSNGLSADTKRASKFTLSERGRLRELSASLDGAGGVAGSQSVKLVVYRDNNGVPGTKVVESSSRTLASGISKTWYSFAVSNVLLNPGDYWIAIFTGGTAQVLRDYGDATPNWVSNSDTYSDGASDPFGAVNTGSVTLSVRGGYSPE